ncbi:MAG: copper amine oxidase N-terminal domain-containing protein [Clostridiales bacterium]|nr:copper amine oxidase N-terminal domain-containing protein [Clostridiales bacterium]
MLKKIIVLAGMALITAGSLNTVFCAEEIAVKVNGEKVEFDQSPIVENGRTLIPFRAVLEEMGLSVDWDADTKTVICTDGEKMGVLTVGSDEMTMGAEGQEIFKVNGGGVYIDGESVPIDAPAKIVNGRTLVPIRVIAESFGADVIWNEESRTVEINIEMKVDESELEKACDELMEILTGIAESGVVLDEKIADEFFSIADKLYEIQTLLDEMEYTQENVDKVTDMVKEIKLRVMDIVREADINIDGTK